MTGTGDRPSPAEATRLDLAIRALPPRERRILTMSRLDGRSHAEIGERLGIGVAEVRQILTRVMLGLVR